MKAITTNVLFTVEGSEGEVYEGTTRCRVSPATRDSYTSYGWVQGDPPEVEILDVVIYCVTVTVQGVTCELKYSDDGFRGLLPEVRKRLEGNADFENDALEAAAGEYQSFMCRGE